MANFKTHKNIGILSSLLFTFFIYSSYKLFINNGYFFNIDTYMNNLTLFLMFLFGVIGSLAPDIDLKTSRPSKYFRKFIYIVTAIFLFSYFSILYPYIKDIIGNVNYLIAFFVLFLLSFIISFIVIEIFESLVEHRGLIHSIPFGILLSIILFEFFHSFNIILEKKDIFIHFNYFYVSALFFIGFITHLLLDEIYSVNLFGMRLKSSFGSALKFYDKNNISGTIIIYILIFYYLFLKINLTNINY